MVTPSKPTCPRCGSENEPSARACLHCGAELVAVAPAEARKVVTVLFSDVKGSTALGEQLDPESLRELMNRYFSEMRRVLERHGGTVEKFIGDAVMAVFGVPQAHEDDALRAVRAAVEMRDALAALNEEFARSWGVQVDTRFGVNTGEVIAGDPSGGQSFVVGEPVNLASRFEQAAGPNEILVGDTTHQLVRDAVDSEPAGTLSLKGVSGPVRAWRVRSVLPGAVEGWSRRLDSPLVGRERELGLLRDAFARASERHACELVTVQGPAGVGKSRLVAEFATMLEGAATVLEGRCLPYGDGITFWPVVGVIRRAAQIAEDDQPAIAARKLHALLGDEGDGPVVAGRLAGLLGLDASAPGIPETFWAVRKLLEAVAATHPLVVAFDDIQWGEPTFLDLVEYISEWISEAPVLLVCMARPEVHEVRPGWGAGKATARLVQLEPLGDVASEGLLTNLLGGETLDREAWRRIADVAEGNPLFLEQTLRMLVDDGALVQDDGRWRLAGDLEAIAIPPTIHAVISARLDRLGPDERSAIERASVVGRVFWWGAVADLSPEQQRPGVGRALRKLVDKGLVQPERSEMRSEDAFRFAHILVRDAAYGAITKTVRAELHNRLAAWITTRMRELVGEFEEILGYHVEQAYRYELELGLPREQAAETARAAAEQLAAAGSRAFARGDMPAAVKLLTRADSLFEPSDPGRLELLPELAFALLETGDFERLKATKTETSKAAAASGDASLRAHAVILGLWIRLFTEPEGWAEEAEREAMNAAESFAAAGDERGLVKAWSVIALVHMFTCRFGNAEQAWRTAADHARRAGDRRDELESLAWVPLTIWAGPATAEQAETLFAAFGAAVKDDRKAMSSVLVSRAVFQAGLGRTDEARDLVAAAKSLAAEAALTVWLHGPIAQFAGWAELLCGDPARAEQELRPGYEALTEIGEVAWLSTLAAILGEAVLAQGRVDEAAELAEVSRGYTAPDDVYSQVMWRAVQAGVAARRGELDEAERLARDSAAAAEAGDFLHLRWHSHLRLAEVLSRRGRDDEARAAADAAAAAAREKGAVVGVEQARALQGAEVGVREGVPARGA